MRTGFKSVERGLEAGFPLRLYHKAKRLFWDPAALDFTQDRATYEALDPRAQDLLLRLTSLFLGGEEAVTLDLLPLVRVVAQEGRLEEEMYLTTFLLEEAKHVEFFARFLEEVASAKGGLAHYHGSPSRRIFHELLPEAMGRLEQDPSPRAEVEAALLTHPQVAEAAAIGLPGEEGERLVLFVVPRTKDLPEELKPLLAEKLKAHLFRHLGPLGAVEVFFTESLPRTRSGKILRRLLKAQELGKDPGDLSTLEE